MKREIFRPATLIGLVFMKPLVAAGFRRLPAKLVGAQGFPVWLLAGFVFQRVFNALRFPASRRFVLFRLTQEVLCFPI